MALIYVLQPQSRHAIRANLLFHEQKNSPNFQAAEIELVIMNEERRLSMIPSDEINLIWSMGLKKDNLRINGKSYPTEQWTTMLKTAGLGRDNYFVIRQGECVKLAMASPLERLNMLESFAGCSDFQDKLEQSQKLLDDSKQSVEMVGTDLETLQKQIDELTKDRAVIEKYQKYVDIERALKYVLLKMEQDELNKKMDKFTKKRAASRQEQSKQRKELTKQLLKLEECKDKLENWKTLLKRLEVERESLQEELENRSREAQKVEGNLEGKLKSEREREKV